MSMRIFVFDDEVHIGGLDQRDDLKKVLAGHELTFATTPDEAIKVYTGEYDLMLLDHDMEGFPEHRMDYPNTGFKFVQWLTQKEVMKVHPVNKPQVILHSHNHKGRARMMHLLNLAGFHVAEMPYSHKYIQFLKDSFGLGG